jgi:endonuclease/exonuclease/phosphatase family metal-dependent hydrolase
MGDFNEQWRSEDSVVRRLVEEAGMKAYQPESDDLPTYKSKRLDWILVSRELEFVRYQVLGEEVSDHRMVTAELRWGSES